LPETALWLTHRVGRTARNGAAGRALTFLSADDAVKWRKLRREGAPDLSWVDDKALITTGEMHAVAAPPFATADPQPRRPRGDGRAYPPHNWRRRRQTR